mmetsp:Transcript_13360/g.49634  ORF Transcript_13360/g.49634 Transcript_13360/m.49634 type:complete len:400 (-) Transcript_13360:814-2013(-)
MNTELTHWTEATIAEFSATQSMLGTKTAEEVLSAFGATLTIMRRRGIARGDGRSWYGMNSQPAEYGTVRSALWYIIQSPDMIVCFGCYMFCCLIIGSYTRREERVDLWVVALLWQLMFAPIITSVGWYYGPSFAFASVRRDTSTNGSFVMEVRDFLQDTCGNLGPNVAMIGDCLAGFLGVFPTCTATISANGVGNEMLSSAFFWLVGYVCRKIPPIFWPPVGVAVLAVDATWVQSRIHAVLFFSSERLPLYCDELQPGWRDWLIFDWGRKILLAHWITLVFFLVRGFKAMMLPFAIADYRRGDCTRWPHYLRFMISHGVVNARADAKLSRISWLAAQMPMNQEDVLNACLHLNGCGASTSAGWKTLVDCATLVVVAQLAIGVGGLLQHPLICIQLLEPL